MPDEKRALFDDLAPPQPVEREQKNPTRDGEPKLSGAKARKHPMFVKRRREGPFRSNA